MKKIFMMMALFVFSLGAFFVPVSAEEYEENGFKYDVYEKEATITGGKIEGDQLVIPEKIGGFPVTGIGDEAFRKNKFTSIQLPDSIVNIGWNAFRNSKNLKTIRLPKNLKVIGSRAFSNCAKLETINFNNKLNGIDYGAFSGCISLTKITLPKNVEYIADNSFAKCYKLKSIKLNEKLETIGEDAFYMNYDLKTITIPKNVDVVRKYAFERCDNLTTVRFQGKNTKLELGVFYVCKSLKTVTLPKKMKNIPEFTFYGCESLSSVKIPKNVTIIKQYAFYECSKLKKISLNKKVYALGDSAFAYSGLKKMKLNAKMQFIGNGAFKATNIRTFKITPKVSFIGNRVFADCKKMKKIYIPASVKGINPGAFNNCSSLQEINVSGGNPSYSSESGVLYDKNKTKLIQYPLNKKSKVFSTPSTVERIRAKAFAGNSKLEQLTITARVIGKQACYDMSSLQKVTITSGTTNIGESAFASCYSLREVNLPDSVKCIGYEAFVETDLREIRIPSFLTKLGDAAFRWCSKLKRFTGGEGAKYSVEDGVLYNGNKTTLLQYPTKKANAVFNVPNSVKKVESYAFAGVKKLKKIEFGSGVEKLKYHSIYDMKNLKSIVFSSAKLKSASYYAISECENLAVIVGPNTYTLENLANSADATMITL